MRRVRRRVQQGNCDGCRAQVAQGLNRRPRPGFVERLLDLPLGVHAFGNAQRCDDPAGQWAGALAAGQKKDVLEAGGNQKANARSIGRRRIQAGRAVNHRADVAGRHPGFVCEPADAAGDRRNRIVGPVGRFQRMRRAGIVEEQQIREGIPDIDPQTMGHRVSRVFVARACCAGAQAR